MTRALFGCRDRGVAPELVLLLRLIALAWIATGHAMLFFTRSTPFFDALVPLADSTIVAWGTLIVGAACAVNLVLGRKVRASAITLGALIFATTLLSRAYFSNNRLFTACVLVLAGLAPAEGSPRLLRAQIVAVYLGAGLDKLLDPDWRSGAFMRSFARGLASHGRLWSPGHDARAPHAPARALAALFDAFPRAAVLASFGTILVELAIAALFATGRVRAAIACGLAFHVGVLVHTGSPMGMFFYTATAAYFAYVTLPDRIELAVPGRLATVMRFLDPDQRLLFRAARFELGPALAALVQLPAFYVLVALLLAGPWFSIGSVVVLLPLVLLLRRGAEQPPEVREMAGELNS